MRTIGTIRCAAAGGLLLALATVLPAGAAQESDWPCVQRLVPSLEAGQMWSGPPLDSVAGRPAPPELDQLARALIDPDLAPEAMDAKVRAFADAMPAEQRAERLTLLFRTALDRLNEERANLIAGIKRYAKRQRALAEKITAETRDLAAAKKDAPGDGPRLQELQAAYDWDTRVFTDRARQLRLVCDQPVRLEQRAFALARAIQGHLP
ncbi:hypothetical protein [Benzoatithermus flavus]|uniref:LTXXQ motif family protein n=1 Tax=Benzoatithermus flavus TaxID=3108223 RepID=A0ABU8XPF0_9PROT